MNSLGKAAGRPRENRPTHFRLDRLDTASAFFATLESDGQRRRARIERFRYDAPRRPFPEGFPAGRQGGRNAGLDRDIWPFAARRHRIKARLAVTIVRLRPLDTFPHRRSVPGFPAARRTGVANAAASR
jgi:hypothetical protein